MNMEEVQYTHIKLSYGPVQGAIATLTLLTAVVHLYLAFTHGIPTRLIPILFLLNGIGYLVLLVALYLPELSRWQRPIRWLLIAYTALTVIIWAVLTHAGYDLFDYLDKLIEVALIILLIVEERLAIRSGTTQVLSTFS